MKKGVNKIKVFNFLFLIILLSVFVMAIDSDGDGIDDSIDNCPVYNPLQEDYLPVTQVPKETGVSYTIHERQSGQVIQIAREIDTDGNRMLIYGTDGNTDTSFDIYVLLWNGMDWEIEDTLPAGDGGGYAKIGGSYIVVYDYDPIGDYANGVPTLRFYERSGSDWNPDGEIPFPQGGLRIGNFEYGGLSPHFVLTDKDDKKAYVFRRDGPSDWNQKAVLTPSPTPTNDEHFGQGLAFAGQDILISASGRLADGLNHPGTPGRVYHFRNLPETDFWVQEDVLTAPNSAINDYFGVDIDNSPSKAIIGAPRAGPSQNGEAYVYRKNGNKFELEQTLNEIVHQPQALGTPWFGSSVAIENTLTVVGSYASGESGTVHAYIFDGANWIGQHIPVEELENGFVGEWYGFSVGIVDGFPVARGITDNIIIQHGPGIPDEVLLDSTSVWSNEGDGIGDACQTDCASGDVDGDGVCDDVDNCPAVPNADQRDYLPSIEVQPSNILEAQNGFSTTMAIDGDTMFAGSSSLNEVDGNGILYVFNWDGNSWVQGQKLESWAIVPTGSLYGLSADISGDWAIVGEPGTGNGRVYFYKYDGSSWQREQTINENDPNYKMFGRSVKIHNNWALITERPSESGDWSIPARALFYKYDGSNWVLKETFLSEFSNEFFSISLSDDSAALYEQFDPVNFLDGHVHVFSRSGDTWTRDVILSEDNDPVPSVGQEWDMFGWGLSIEGDDLIIGSGTATTYGGTNYPTGSVSHFKRISPGNWQLQQKMFSSNSETMGWRLAHEGNTIVVSASIDSIGRVGGVVYKYDGAQWNEYSDPLFPSIIDSTYPTNAYTWSLEVSGDRIFVGDWGSGSSTEGSVHVFEADGIGDACQTDCGNGLLDGEEECDDDNTNNGDGCSSICTIESGWTCVGEPSDCSLLPSCGNGLLDGEEECDDGCGGDGCTAADDGDGCSSICTIESGWECIEEPSICTILPCSFTSLEWDRLTAIEGDSVSLMVTGSGACDGEEVSFVVWESDFLNPDDPVEINPSNVDFSGSTATATWNAEYMDDASGDPEYYFIATLDSDNSISENSGDLLIVTQAPATECGNGICEPGETVENCGLDHVPEGDCVCGDGIKDEFEECDLGDDNGLAEDGFGCSDSCTENEGWYCTGEDDEADGICFEIPSGLCGELDTKTKCEKEELWTFEVLQSIETIYEDFADANGLDFDFCTIPTNDGADCSCFWDSSSETNGNCLELVTLDRNNDGDGDDFNEECYLQFNQDLSGSCDNDATEYSIGWTAFDNPALGANDPNFATNIGCIDGSDSFQCPSRVKLPFFTMINFMITLLTIYAIYFVLRRDFE